MQQKNLVDRIYLFFKKNIEYVSVFFLCFAYWGYLICSADIIVVFDAINYEQLGEMIYKKGWIEFFRTGPHREPFYPLVISLSMKIANALDISYYYIQKAIQVFALFTTQILLLVLLAKLKIHKRVQLAIILYCGFSPALVNSAFSLFSEIITYPFVLLAVLFVSVSWNEVHGGNRSKVIFMAMGSAVSFLLAAFNKAIFIYVFLGLLIPFLVIMVSSGFFRQKKTTINSFIYLIVAFGIFFICIFSYKWMNKRHNGNFEFTTRSDNLLFGNAYKRANPLTGKIVAAHLASIPGAGVCKMFFSEKECRYCEFHAADSYLGPVLNAVLNNVEEENKKKRIIEVTLEKMKQHPFQYLFFMAVESCRMPFWESTQVGFVDYPKWLKQLYSNKGVRYGLRLVVSLMTVLSLVFFIWEIVWNRKLLLNFSQEGRRMHIGFFSILIIGIFTLLYSLFSVVTRYAFPIVPLYLLIIAFSVQKKIFRS